MTSSSLAYAVGALDITLKINVAIAARYRLRMDISAPSYYMNKRLHWLHTSINANYYQYGFEFIPKILFNTLGRNYYADDHQMADFGPMSKLRDNMATGTDRGYGATLAIFGGSGATGRLLVQTSLAQGYKVRALVRNAASLNLGSDGLTVITGSVLKGDDVANCLNGCDAVICVLGPRPPYTDIFCQAATATIVESMQACGIKRLVVQTGGMIGDYPANRSLPFRLMTAP